MRAPAAWLRKYLASVACAISQRCWVANGDAARGQKLTEALERAVRFLDKAKSSTGGWHETSTTEGHDFASMSATAIQIQALRAASEAGISIPSDAIPDAKAFLKKEIEETK